MILCHAKFLTNHDLEGTTLKILTLTYTNFIHIKTMVTNKCLVYLTKVEIK